MRFLKLLPMHLINILKFRFGLEMRMNCNDPNQNIAVHTYRNSDLQTFSDTMIGKKKNPIYLKCLTC